jgi:hypothetical protein
MPQLNLLSQPMENSFINPLSAKHNRPQNRHGPARHAFAERAGKCSIAEIITPSPGGEGECLLNSVFISLL